jgi:hypothetical protein
MRLLFSLAVVSLSCDACSCVVSFVPKAACELAWQSEATFTGEVTDIVDPGIPFVKPGERPLDLDRFPRKKVTLRVREAFTGLASGTQQITIETGLGGGDCGYAFERGVEYLVYAYRTRAGGLGTGICSRTRPITEADDDLKYLRSLQDRGARSSLRVIAIDLHRMWGLPASRAGNVIGLSGAKISVEGANYRQTGETDWSGRHEFTDVPAGEYKITMALDGYRLTSPIPPVRLHAKGCADVALPVRLDRVVTGRVFTKDGMPAAGVTIEAVPMRPKHANDLPFPADSATTDLDGRYELLGLHQTGEYYLGTSIGNAPSKENPFRRWFYPGTEHPEQAVPVHIYDKPERQTFNLTLPDAQRTRVIEGVVVWPDGKPAVDAQIMVVEEGWGWQVPRAAGSTDNSGRFATEGLDGVSYRANALLSTNGERFAKAVTIEPGPDRAQLRLVLTLAMGHTLTEPGGKSLEHWRLGPGLR